jgi:hypothetical protein
MKASKNPFNVPVVMGEFTNKLIDKLMNQTSKEVTPKQLIKIINEIAEQMCSDAELELIEEKALGCLLSNIEIVCKN